MHLIECDGCKRQELFYSGVSKREADSKYPQGWGVKAAKFKGGPHHWDSDRQLLLHACQIGCALPAVQRAKACLPELTMNLGHKREPLYGPWQGFKGVKREDWEPLYAAALEDGGMPRPEAAAPKKSRGAKIFDGALVINDGFPPTIEAATEVPLAPAPFPEAPAQVDPGPALDDFGDGDDDGL